MYSHFLIQYSYHRA